MWFSYMSTSHVDNILILCSCVQFCPYHLAWTVLQQFFVVGQSSTVSMSCVALWLPGFFIFVQYGIVNSLMSFHFTGETFKPHRAPSAGWIW